MDAGMFPICCLQALVKGPQGKNCKFLICSGTFGLGTHTGTVFGMKTAFLHHFCDKLQWL